MSLIFIADPAYCKISDAQIKAASKTFTDILQDWVPAIVGGGLMFGGVSLFANNFRTGIAALAATGFIYASKSFVSAGEGAMIQNIAQVLGIC